MQPPGAGPEGFPYWLPSAETVTVPGRGELYARVHRHDDPMAPTVVLLHGWTSSSDLGFFPVFESLAERYSIVAPDHRGHGRGAQESFTLEAVADDIGALLDALFPNRVSERGEQRGLDRDGPAGGLTVLVGFSMGGPLALLVARRRDDVAAVVPQSTFLDWDSSRRDRIRRRVLPYVRVVLRRRWYRRVVARSIRRLVPDGHPLDGHRDWLVEEFMLHDPRLLSQAAAAIARFDGRPWLDELDVDAAMLITTADRVVPPAKQWALAAALSAETELLDRDHLAPLTHPAEYATATRRVVDVVVERVAQRAASPSEF